jgi:hypothetical protein
MKLSFNKLCSYLQPYLTVDEVMSTRRTKKEAISVEIIASCYLSWIGGGVYLEIWTAAGISIASFYRHVKKCIVAINQCPMLCYHFPKTATEMQTAVDGFKAISSNNAIEGCVACVDGYLLKIKAPASKEVGNVRSFFWSLPDLCDQCTSCM